MNIKKLLLIIFAISLFINISLFSWPSNSSKSNSKEQDIIDSSSGFTKRKGGKKIIREKVISTGSKRIFNEQNEKNEVSESNVLDSEILKVVTLNENRLQGDNIVINAWNPPSSLALHMGKGSVTNSDPIYHFNLNLGWLRFFTKSNNIFYDRYLVNTGIPMVIELKPFDLTSFITSGSGYSIYVENNEWLRNLTLIFSNRVFSSTQFITSSMLWYGDFMANAVKIKTFFPSSNSETSESALEKLYPSTIDFGLGISDRIHVYQTSKMSIGIMFYFEAIVPKSREVAKNYLDLPPVGQFHVQRFTPSSTFTFATMGGVFFRYVKGYIDFYAQTTYQRRQGDFDAWTIGLKQNTVLSKVGVLLYEQFDFYFQHFLINWSLDLLSEESTINFFNVGSEIRGFGKKFYWIGLGFEGVYHIFHQDRAIYGGYIGKINGISLISSLNFYPLSLHSKDHRLKLSLIYGIFSFRQQGSGTPHPSFNINLDEKTSWNYALFFRVTYNI